MSKMMWCLDPGHGRSTPGKRSPKWPNGTQLFEWEFNRDVTNRVIDLLKEKEISYFEVVTVDADISLPERARLANMHPTKLPKVLLSIHANAMGDGVKHNDANGFEIWTTEGQNQSDRLAEVFFQFFKQGGVVKKMRAHTKDGDSDMEKNFTVIYLAKMPAVLLELGFYTHRDECALLLNPLYRQRLAGQIVAAIEYVEENGFQLPLFK